jgi:UDP-GlcNAc:undecaprenyl-phosphate GlcNAc-1-phosphate transferase
MERLFYFQPFLSSFAVAVCVLFLLQAMVARRGNTGIAFFSRARRFGGVAILFGFLFSVFSNDRLVITSALFGMIIGSIAILCFGLWDDIKKLGWKIQLVFQIALGSMLFVSGFRILSLPVPFVGHVFLETVPLGAVVGFCALLLWIVLVMNVLNWADGIDGLLPSVSLVSCSVIFLLSLAPEVNQPPIGILSAALLGSILAFLFWNVPPARILAGTSGSFFIGFAISSLAVLSGTKIATALLVLLLPVLDALWVFFERLLSGVSPFRGDVRHLHYRLRDIGWSDRRIVVWYTLFTTSVGILALSTRALGKTVSFALMCGLVILFLAWVRKTVHKRQKTHAL